MAKRKKLQKNFIPKLQNSKNSNFSKTPILFQNSKNAFLLTIIYMFYIKYLFNLHSHIKLSNAVSCNDKQDPNYSDKNIY